MKESHPRQLLFNNSGGLTNVFEEFLAYLCVKHDRTLKSVRDAAAHWHDAEHSSVKRITERFTTYDMMTYLTQLGFMNEVNPLREHYDIVIIAVDPTHLPRCAKFLQKCIIEQAIVVEQAALVSCASDRELQEAGHILRGVSDPRLIVCDNAHATCLDLLCTVQDQMPLQDDGNYLIVTCQPNVVHYAYTAQLLFRRSQRLCAAGPAGNSARAPWHYLRAVRELVENLCEQMHAPAQVRA